MELKNSLKSFSDRELLELILCNQVFHERRLDRMEIYLHRKSNLENEEAGKDNDYNLAPHNQDGRQEGYYLMNNFKELIEKAYDTRKQINEFLKREDSEISW